MTQPEGGLFIQVTIPPSMNAEDMLEKAVNCRVAFVPGAPFCNDDHGTHTHRLNYTFPSLDQIEMGTQRLGEILAKAIETSVT